MSFQIAVILTAVSIAAACSLSGIFLVIRRMAMMADAISHSVLPGLVAAYVIARGPNLLAGILGAAAAGLLSVVLGEAATRLGKLKNDAAIGLVFPTLFALGVLIVSRFYSNVHIDADSVLSGNLEYVALDPIRYAGYNFGPKAMGTGILLILFNAIFLKLLWRPLKAASFDQDHTRSQGISTASLHIMLMTLVSITAVGAFSAVGAIMAVSLIAAPAATALLLARRMNLIVILTLILAATGALVGTQAAYAADLSISGCIAVALGLQFALAACFAPERGVVSQFLDRRKRRSKFAAEALVIHLSTHEGTDAYAEESNPAHLSTELGWSPKQIAMALQQARRRGWVTGTSHLELTNQGRTRASQIAADLGLAPALASE